MSQRQRSAKPDKIQTLADWVARWPKAQNLGFDPVTREPTVYVAEKGGAVAKVFPWKREADTLTVLSQPTRFTADAQAMALRRYEKIHDQQSQMRAAKEEQLRIQVAILLEAWRTYNAASPALRGSLQRDIMTAEAEVREIEAQLVPRGRLSIQMDIYTGIYVPPMPDARRGIPLTGTVEDVSSEGPSTVTGIP